MAGPGIEPGTSDSCVRRATDCATRPGLTTVVAMNNESKLFVSFPISSAFAFNLFTNNDHIYLYQTVIVSSFPKDVGRLEIQVRTWYAHFRGR